MESKLIMAWACWLIADALEILRDSIEISRTGILWIAGKAAGL